MLKLFQSHIKTFLEAPLPHFNVEPLMDNDFLCNKLGSSTLRRGRGETGNKIVIVPTLLSMVVGEISCR